MNIQDQTVYLYQFMPLYQDTIAAKKIFQLRKKIRAISGGTGASKTVSILIWLIDYAQTGKSVIDVVSESYPHLEQGAIREFKNIMIDRDYWKDERWNDTKHIYIFETESTLQFQSYDKLGKAHGPRRDVLFVNECNWLPWDVIDQLIVRTREVVWLDWNPVSEFWYYTELQGKRNDIDFLKLTFQDNKNPETGEWVLSEAERKEIEARRNNLRWWRVYGEGLLGEAEGRIYTGWQIIEEIPFEARLERYGLNFGYFPHPLGLVAVYYYNGGYILDEILYGNYIENTQIAATLLNLPKALVIADSAEPKSIAEIRRLKINIIGAEKGKESKRYGVKTVQAQRISVTSRSINLIKEYRNYFQSIDRKTNFSIIGEYDGDYFILDGVRYAICSLLPIQQRKEILSQLPKFPNIPQTNPV